MADVLDYSFMFEQALQKIKTVREPHSENPEPTALKWNQVVQQALFNFGGRDYEKYTNVIVASKKISISCINIILIQLLGQYHIPFEQIEVGPEKDRRSSVSLAIKDKVNDTLLLFKEIEECSIWKVKDSEPIKELMRKCGASSCKYIYYMLDYAYLQVIGHNDDESDPGRGYNLYSLKWFFTSYFGIEECERFTKNLEKYLCDVKNYLGYIIVKSLTPHTLLNFRKVTENSIIKFKYEQLVQKRIRRTFQKQQKEYSLSEAEYVKLKTHFIESNIFSVMLGKHDFAESLMTAEWLHDSMKSAQAIDLTTIGMGYFKAVEQLLWDLVCLHKNEGKCIKKGNSKKKPHDSIPLNDENIASGAVDTTIGAMVNFYKDNLDMLRSTLLLETKEYILETLFEYKDVRNGYFHKHNISSWSKIEEIRDLTFSLVFLLLAAQQLSDADREQLGISCINVITDYYRLCEYINYHSDELFFLNFGSGKEDIFLSCVDGSAKTIEDSYIDYSGVYFRNLGKNGQIYRFSEDNLPNEIFLGKLNIPQTEDVRLEPVKIKKIFENGKFVGPSIAEEEKLDY
jgi:hypothetical protein